MENFQAAFEADCLFKIFCFKNKAEKRRMEIGEKKVYVFPVVFSNMM